MHSLRQARERFNKHDFIPQGSMLWHLLRNRFTLLCTIFLIVIILGALFAPLLTAYPEQGLGVPNITEKFQPPSLAYPLGTDSLGRDVWARILYGARTSLLIGFSIVFFGSIIGIALGAVAGYFGGWIDEIVMRVTDIFLSFPPLLLAIVVAVVLEPSIRNTIVVITLVWWPWYTRIVRGQVMLIREQEYVRATQAIGVADLAIIWQHIIPNVMGSVLVQATLDLGMAILTASALSFLGLGTRPPTADWGVMVNEGRQHLLSGRWWLAIFPGMALFLTAMALNLVGDGVRDAADPKTIGR